MNSFAVGVELLGSDRQTVTDRQTDVTAKKSISVILGKSLKSGEVIRTCEKLTI